MTMLALSFYLRFFRLKHFLVWLSLSFVTLIRGQHWNFLVLFPVPIKKKNFFKTFPILVPICNTMYKIVNGTIPREICTNVPQTYCNKETKVVEDKTCQTETKIECKSLPSSLSFEKSVNPSGSYENQDYR